MHRTALSGSREPVGRRDLYGSRESYRKGMDESWFKGPLTEERVGELRRKLGSARGALQELLLWSRDAPGRSLPFSIEDVLEETKDP